MVNLRRGQTLKPKSAKAKQINQVEAVSQLPKTRPESAFPQNATCVRLEHSPGGAKIAVRTIVAIAGTRQAPMFLARMSQAPQPTGVT